MTNTLIPPAGVQQGRKDTQYIPTELSAAICVALVIQGLKDSDGVIEVKDMTKLDQTLNEFREGGFGMVLWSPFKKNHLGDLAFGQDNQPVPAEGSRFIQLVSRPRVVTPEKPKLELVQ